MSSSLYTDNSINSAPTPGNGITTAPTQTLRHYGVGYSPQSEYVTSSPDAWPPTYGAGWLGPDNSATPSLADNNLDTAGNNTDTPSINTPS